MKQYGVMLIGCGHIGMEHLMNICWQDRVRMEVVVDVNAEAAEYAAKRSGAKAWGTDYRPFLKKKNVDVVVIATYTDTHLPIMLDCLAHHKHVLCEKPIGSNLEDGRKFVEAVKNANEQVLVGYILRQNRSYKKIRELIRDGAIGELRLVRICQNHHALDWPRYSRLLQDCPPAVDCGVHYFDLVHWITGSRIVSVNGFAAMTQEGLQRSNYNMITFRLENGCAGVYEAGWGENIRFDNTKEFIGTKGRISLKLQDTRGEDREEGDCITVYHSDTGLYETINLQSRYKNMYGQLCMLFDMIDSSSKGYPVSGSPSIEDVWRSFRVAMTAQRALETGETQSLNWQPGE